MDYEKKYKELVEYIDLVAHSALTQDQQELMNSIRQKIYESKESEDERIRKALIEWFDQEHTVNDFKGIAWKEVVAWLKKQGENNTDKIIERARTEKQRVLLTETNGDANIDWDCRSLDDVKILLSCGLEFIRTIEANKQILADNRFGGCSIRVPTRYDKGIKQGEQKSIEWSGKIGSKHATGKLKEMIDKKENPAWSEEDETMITDLSIIVHTYFSEISGIPFKYDLSEDKIRTWLKSLRPQNTWKPSDEQMNGLNEAIKFLGCTKTRREQLQSLYEQLKKLREE